MVGRSGEPVRIYIKVNCGWMYLIAVNEKAGPLPLFGPGPRPRCGPNLLSWWPALRRNGGMSSINAAQIP